MKLYFRHFVIVVCMFMCGYLYAGETVNNVLIIKFKADSPLRDVAQDYFNKGLSFVGMSEDFHLDELMSTYPIQSFKKFPSTKTNLDLIKEKYPNRAKRMSQEQVEDPFSFVYIIQFVNQDLDLKEISRLFSLDDHIEYAQPDFRASIHSEELQDD